MSAARRAIAGLAFVGLTMLPVRAGAQSAGQDLAPPAPEPAAVPPRQVPAWSMHLAAGAGVHSRALDLPVDGVVLETRTGLFPAIDLGLSLDRHMSPAFSLGLHARYQTSIGLRITELHTDGRERVQGVRSHRLEIALAPALRIDDAGRWIVVARLGYGTIDLRPESHLVTPGYHLSGPFAEAELQLPLGLDWLRLRLGPEVLFIVLVGRELPRRGIGSAGLGVGGSAALEVVLSERWIVAAGYRELRAWVDSSQPQSLVDVSRFITARVMGTL